MSDAYGRKIMDGKPGDKYLVPVDYVGKWKNAVGIPVDDDGNYSPQPNHGKPQYIPQRQEKQDDSDSESDTESRSGHGMTTVKRPNFHKVDKNSQVFADDESDDD